MTNSVSERDESNPASWLTTQVGKIELACPLGNLRRVPREKSFRKRYNKSFVLTTCSVKMTGYWPRSIFASLWTSTSYVRTEKTRLARVTYRLTYSAGELAGFTLTSSLTFDTARSIQARSEFKWKDPFRVLLTGIFGITSGGGPHISVGIFRPKFAVPFLANWFFALSREFDERI